VDDPACLLDQPCVVGRPGQQLVAAVQHALERGAAKHLRGLYRPQSRAIQRPRDRASARLADLLDRVGDR
jgi:hypothetical protein